MRQALLACGSSALPLLESGAIMISSSIQAGRAGAMAFRFARAALLVFCAR
jgi:hypothetical protein